MIKRWLAILLVMAMLVVPTNIGAQDTDNNEFKSYGFQITEDEQKAYYDAVQDCQTPSLECLVKNVSRFTAIEWIYNILGDSHREALDSVVAPDNESSDAGAGGAVAGLTTLMGAMYANPPASAGTYVADLFDSLHVTQPAYAQGLGFAALDPILPLWKQFRNLAYLFFVVIFIVIGFMIMFRTKIGGQTAVTAQQAIPNVIVALLAVTFSYAIAGFLIDMMYLAMLLIVGIFGETFGDTNILSYNIFELFGRLWKAGPANVTENVTIAKQFLAGLTGTEGAAATIGGLLGGLMLTLLLAVAVLIGTVRLFFELLKSYASVVMGVLTSPIQLMFGALPGNKAFILWFKDLVGNLIPFPTVLLVVVMFYQFTNTGTRTSGGFNPPFLLNNGVAGSLGALMGLALILALPDIVKKIKEPLVRKDGFGQFLAGAAATNIKAASPMTGRLASLGAGAGYGLARGATRFVRSKGDLGQAAQAYRTHSAKAAGAGIKFTNYINRSVGANQPDYLNPISQAIDKRWSPETAKREESFQMIEDYFQRARQNMGGINVPPQNQTPP